MNNQLQNLITGSFVITVLMVTFSWIGLTGHDFLKSDSLDLLHKTELNVFDLPQDLLPEIKMLEISERFESKLVGAAASISENYLAHEKIKASEHSELIFNYLLSSENTVAQIYAIKGLKDNNSDLYQKYKNYFENSAKSIQRLSGCSVYEEPVKSIISRFDRERKNLK